MNVLYAFRIFSLCLVASENEKTTLQIIFQGATFHNKMEQGIFLRS